MVNEASHIATQAGEDLFHEAATLRLGVTRPSIFRGSDFLRPLSYCLQSPLFGKVPSTGGADNSLKTKSAKLQSIWLSERIQQ